MKKFLISLLAIFMIATGGAVLYVLTLDFNSYKPQISKAVKDASGLDFVIEGDISPSLSPIGLSVSGVKVANPESFDKNTFFSLKTFDVAVELKPLLNKEIKIEYVDLKDIDLNIIKSKKGELNVAVKAKEKAKKETTQEQKSDAKLPLVMVDRVLLSNVNITYTDLATKAKALIKDVDLIVTDIAYDSSKKGLNAISFKSDTKIANVIYDVYDVSNIETNVALKDAIITANKIDYSIFESRAVGSAKVDLNGKSPRISVKEHIPELNLEVVSKVLAKKDLLKGTVDTKADISFSGKDAIAIKKSVSGTLEIVGKSVGINGYDIDKVLSSYKNTQSVNAKDIGAFLVAGPIGTLLTKGADVGSAFDSFKGGTTLLKDVVIKTDIKKGVVALKDVAISTSKNRLAVKGALDLPREKFKNVSVGILNAKGCADFSQTIVGTFKKPSVKVDETAVKQVTNMVGSIFGKVKNILPVEDKKECKKPFYKGSVAHPTK